MKVRARKRKNGKVIFFMDYYLNGRRHQKKLEAVATKKEAQQVADLLWAKLVREATLGEYAPETPADRCIKLGEVLKNDLERPGVSEWTVRMERSLGNHLRRLLGETTPVLSITTQDIEGYKRVRSRERIRKLSRAMEQRGEREEDIPFVKNVTINKELQYLRAVLNRVRSERVIPRIPCQITTLPTEKSRARALTEKELLAVLGACAEHSEDMLEKTIFFANTGFRKSEVFNARWSDLEHTAGYIRVLTKKKGTSNEYYEDLVPLNTAAQEALQARQARAGKEQWPHDLIFAIPPEERRRSYSAKPGSRPGEIDGIVCYWDHCYGEKLKACSKAAGIKWWKDLRIHHLRHSFATIALDKGANIMEVARLVRHRDPMLTVRTYLHTRDEAVVRVVETLNLRKEC